MQFDLESKVWMSTLMKLNEFLNSFYCSFFLVDKDDAEWFGSVSNCLASNRSGTFGIYRNGCTLFFPEANKESIENIAKLIGCEKNVKL